MRAHDKTLGAIDRELDLLTEEILVRRAELARSLQFQ
jgi:hypothetical protein